MNKSILHSTRGSALLVSLILITAISIVITHVFKTTIGEARLTAMAVGRMDADNVAEVLLDYGLSDIAARFSSDSSFDLDEFSPSQSPLVVQKELVDLFAGTNVDTSSLFLSASKLSEPLRYYVNPSEPINTFDPHKGLNLYLRNLDIYSRATVIDPIFGNVTSYAQLRIQIRDAPLFGYAVFYNMDLEYHPGPYMEMNGPVHSNGTIWLLEVGGLKFHDSVTAHKDIRVGMKSPDQQFQWKSNHAADTLYFKDAEDKWKSLYRGSGSKKNTDSYYTSISDDSVFKAIGYENWREYASNEFGGNLRSGAHGVAESTPSGILPYVADEDGATEKENHGYALIEPSMGIANPMHKGDGEHEKFARKAGLIVRVHRDLNRDGVDDDRSTPIPAHAVHLRSRPKINDGWSTAARPHYDYYDGLAQNGLSGPMSSEAVGPQLAAENNDGSGDGASSGSGSGSSAGSGAAASSGPDHPSLFDTDYHISLATLQRVDPTNPMSPLVKNSLTTQATLPDGTTKTTIIDGVIEIALPLAADFDKDQTDADHNSAGDELRARFDEIFAAHPLDYDSSAKVLHRGMVDQRIKRADKSTNGRAYLSLVEINMAALADFLENGDSTFVHKYTPKDFFNGVLYVEFPPDTTAVPRSKDKITHAVQKLALVLTEGGGPDKTKGRVPNPSYNKVSPREEGFTLATNAPLYTRGHFNADGNFSTPSSGSVFASDSAGSPDAVVALAADAITVLSESWKFERSINTKPKASNTEVCTALLTGILPTYEGGRKVTSGGNHNFIRFLEDWGGKTLRYRGSMVCAFESEIQNDGISTGYYSPPKRIWGYFDRFAQGVFPPGTPTYTGYRKSSLRFISESEFDAEIKSLPWSVTVPALP